MVSCETSQAVLEEVQSRLPFACQVVFLAARGVADTQVMSHLRPLGRHCRSRITCTVWMYPCPQEPLPVGTIDLTPGHMTFWQEVSSPDTRFGPVSLAAAQPGGDDA
jgi:hypothetical protein